MPGKTTRLRIVTALAVCLLIVVGLVTNGAIGTLSAFGWSDITLICPLGALGTMLASKLLVPRALISLVLVVVMIIIFGRAFCSWVCPVPLIQKLKGVFRRKGRTTDIEISSAVRDSNKDNTADDSSKGNSVIASGLSEIDPTKTNLAGSCEKKRSKLDARHFILGGSLLSAAVFGFPVFCLICPIGLSFAFVLLVIRLFGGGDVTWLLIVVPLILFVELFVFRKWCSKICPLSAFMSLLGFFNRTFRPQIDDTSCLENSEGRECGICGKACEEGIDPRHPETSPVGMNECSKCRDCADACPTHAITLPFLPKSFSVTKKSDH